MWYIQIFEIIREHNPLKNDLQLIDSLKESTTPPQTDGV